MRYSEEFKKGTVRLRLSTGMGFAEMSKKLHISKDTLKKWDDEYFYETQPKKEDKEDKQVGAGPKWHKTGAGSGYWK